LQKMYIKEMRMEIVQPDVRQTRHFTVSRAPLLCMQNRPPA